MRAGSSSVRGQDPVVAAANGELMEVKAGDDEHREPEPKGHQRADQQPARVPGCGAVWP